MRLAKAFTIVEVLIALSLSSFIMMGIVQVHRGVMRYLDVTRQMESTNRKVCILFNQFERDLNSAFIPFPYQPVDEKKPEGAPDAPKEETDSKKKEEAKKREEQRKTFFVAGIDDNADAIRVETKKLWPVTYVSFICTNPFQVYGTKRQRLVRVIYQLIADRQKRDENFKTYYLVRKETLDLANVKGAVDQFAPATAAEKVVRTYTVMDNIKGMFIRYSARIKDLRKKEEDKQKEEKPKPDAPKNRLFQQWGHTFEVQGIVPESVEVWLDVWNDAHTQSSRFQIMLSIASYPTEDEDKVRQEKQEKKPDKDKKPDDQQQQAGQQPAQPAQPLQGP